MRTVLNHFGNSACRADATLGEKDVACALRAHWLSGISALFIAGVALTGCGPQQQAGDVSQDKQQQKKITAPQDKPLASFQTNLLQTAFDVATAIPIVPHIKDRSKAQEAVSTLSFELDQPQRALGYIEKIGDWRRGAGYADYAFYCAQHGVTNQVQHYLDLAAQIAEIADQDWRRDRIKIKISRTHTLLGQSEQAGKFETGVEIAESGKVARVEAMLCSENEFAEQMTATEALVASGNFDLVRNALYVYTELFNRFYDNTDRRAKTEEKIKSSWNPLPVFIRIELLMELTKFSFSHNDSSEALRLTSEAKEIFDGAAWKPQHGVPLMARLAALRFRCGETNAARTELRRTLDLFTEKQAEIINIDKAKTLIPVAEAFQITGDVAGALAVYKPAVEAAIENPNSRPRAEDLSAICLSMAKHNIEPDEVLWARIREIKANLGDPW